MANVWEIMANLCQIIANDGKFKPRGELVKNIKICGNLSGTVEMSTNCVRIC